jgi:arylsulfatase A-like enzyme
MPSPRDERPGGTVRRTLVAHLRGALAAALALAIAQAVTGTVALLWVYRGQVLPPAGFFPTQVYDGFAKLGFAVGGALGWPPPLADHFRGIAWEAKLAVLPELLALDLVVALVLGAVVGGLGALVARGRSRGAVGYLWVLGALVLALDVGFWLATIPLGIDATWWRLIQWRLVRSFVLDGALVALVTLASALAVSRIALAAVEHRPRLARRAAIATAALLALLGGVSRGGGAIRAGSAPSAASAPSVGAGWNVLLISIDSLRADHLGCYGYRRETSPAIDRLAGEGIRFTQAMSPTSWTLPSHISLFSGRYTLSHGVATDLQRLPHAIPTLGETLHAAGYRTAGFVSGPYLAGHYGYDRGMETYEDLSARYEHRREARSAVVAPTITEMAERWLETHARERFFLFLHYFDVHYDYIPPPPYDTMFDPDYRGTVDGRNLLKNARVNARMDPRDLEHVKALYDGEIRFTDGYVGKLLDTIERLGLRGRTMVLITADHGDEFFEHGSKGHQRTLYDEVLHVPLIVRLPNGAGAGRTVTDTVSLVDVMPTVLDALGVDGPAGMDGASLVPAMLGQHAEASREVYGEFYNKLGLNVQVARRTTTTKVIQHFNRLLHPSRAPIEWYDLARDPTEQRSGTHEDGPALHSALDGMALGLERLWRSHREVGEAERVDIDPATRARLESLGYVVR